MLIASSPEKYFKPPYVGGRGRVGVELNRVSDEELDFLLRQAWRMIASKKLQAIVEQLEPRKTRTTLLKM
jgi:hypothetical protein